MLRRLIGPVMVVLLACVMSGCKRTPVPPPVRGAGPRIVAASPAVGVIVRDLGLADRCVGRHGFDMVLPKSLPVVGSQDGFDYEALIRVAPTVVLTQWGSRELPARLVELAANNGWPMCDSTLLSLNDIRKDVANIDRKLAAAAGKSAPTAEARRLSERMDAAWAKRGEGFAGVGRVLLLASTSPMDAFGPGSCHYEVLERIGGVPAMMAGSAYVTLDVEKLIQLAPDVIVLVTPRTYGSPVPSAEEHAAEVKSQFAHISTLAIPAAAHARLEIIDDPLCQLPSTSMIDFADELAAVLGKMRP